MNGILFPAYTREAWLQSGSISGELQVAAYSVSSFDMVQKTIARQRIRYGAEFIVCTNSLFWQTGQFDGVSRFYRGGEVYEVENPGDAWGHSWMRLRQIWIDTYNEAYWDKVTITNTVTGTQIAETWLQGQNMWLDAVGVWFTRLAASGSAHIAIVEVSDYGLPNLKKVIAQTTLLRENMRLNAETVVPLQPTYLQAGKRYALVVTTAADHWVAVVPGQQFTQGTFFYVLDGAYAQGDAFKDLWMRLYRCKFNQARSVITLNPLQLSGGILAIDMIAGTIVPDGTTLTYEIQVGSTWYNLLDVDKYMLGQGGTIPPLLPLRAVFMGSVDCMPAINLADSSVYVSRPDVYAQHVSPTRTLPAASTQIRVIQRYEGYDPIYHTKSVKLLTGAGFGTQVAPSSTSTYIDPDDGATEVTYVFNLGAAVTQFRKLTRLDTSTNQRVFHVAWEKDYAL